MLTQHACQSVTRRFVTKAELFNLAPSDLVLTPRPDRTLDSGLVRRPLAKAAELLRRSAVCWRASSTKVRAGARQPPTRRSSRSRSPLRSEADLQREFGGRALGDVEPDTVRDLIVRDTQGGQQDDPCPPTP